jgi:anti-sigma factor RsiW
MSCAVFEERIAQYVGGEPDAELEQHLRACSDCAALARELAEDRDWLASHPPEMADVDYAAIRSEIRREIARPQRAWKWVAAAAAVLLAIGVASTFHRSPAPENHVARAVEQTPAPAPAPDRSLAVTAQKRAPKRSPAPLPVTHDPAVRIELATNNPDVTIILLPELKGDTQ